MFTTVMEWVSKNDFGKEGGLAITCLHNGQDDEDDDDEEEEEEEEENDGQAKRSGDTTVDDLPLFASAHDIVMLDVGTHLNLSSNISLNAYAAFREEARKTSDWLNRDTGGSLDTVSVLFSCFGPIILSYLQYI